MTKYLKGIAILALAVWLIATYIWKPVEVTTETETVIEYVEVEVKVEAKPEIKWYPKLYYKIIQFKDDKMYD